MVHGGALMSDEAATRALADEVARALAAREFEVASFPALPVGEDLRAALDAIAPRTRRGAFAVRRLHHRLFMPETHEQWTKTWSSKSRNTLKRKMRRFEEAYPGELSVRLLSTKDDYERIFADLDSIARCSYQRRLGAGFEDTPVFRELVRVALEHGWFRAWVLYRRETPVAFWQGYVVGETFFSSNLGYDAAYADHSPGLYLMSLAFKDLFADDRIQVIDYGLGDADYKRRFGNGSWEEEDVLLFAPTARAVRINLTRSAILVVAQAARTVLDRAGVTARVKKSWRRRLRASS
jgi:CelD/BcsL family acetyltransferase involved in cellulose biosynthesis